MLIKPFNIYSFIVLVQDFFGFSRSSLFSSFTIYDYGNFIIILLCSCCLLFLIQLFEYYDKNNKKILLLKKEVEYIFIEHKKLHQDFDSFQKNMINLLTRLNKNKF
jgi:hypothetical protein